MSLTERPSANARQISCASAGRSVTALRTSIAEFTGVQIDAAGIASFGSLNGLELVVDERRQGGDFGGTVCIRWIECESQYFEDDLLLSVFEIVTAHTQTLARAGMMRKILNELKCRNSAGRFEAYSGPELVERLGCLGGQNAVAGCVRDFRKFVTETLRERLGLLAGPQDVIRSGGPGYRLNEWITVRGAEPAPVAQTPVDSESQAANKRRAWILTELRKGQKLRAPAIAKELGCSAKTIKRELDILRVEGKIEFTGPTKTGFYRLISS
jgi:biotin operon repressor